MMMMSPPYPHFNGGMAAPNSPSSDEKIFPNFARIVHSSAAPGHHRHQQQQEEDVKKPAAVSDDAKFPPGVFPNDVLCGRDKISHAHMGNKHFRRIIETYREVYQNADCRDQKTNITCSVIAKIHNRGGRFLKLNEETEVWEQVSEQYAREKVSHALRSAKDPNRPKVKKPRKTKQYVPTQEEDAAFREALEDQQRIFQTLLDNHVESEGSDNDDYNDDDNAGDGAEQDDAQEEDEEWDFYQ
jgi:hypothetical protein